MLRSLLLTGCLLGAAPLAHSSDVDQAGDVEPRGHAEARQSKWRALALQGDMASQYQLGLLLENGIGMAADPQAALRWYASAAEQGHAPAQDRLGSMYFRGLGTHKDFAQARAWYLRAAAQGLQSARWHLGEAYLGTWPASHEAARYWLELAAAEGSAMQQYRLARWFTDGTFKDQARAVYWGRKAALADMPEAQYLLGRLYAEGKGIGQSFPAAAAWFTKAAGRGHGEAAHALAHLYRHGKGVPRDSAAASRWNCVAAKRGHPNAIYDIAHEPVCLKEAAEMGIPLAQGMLGRWYENPDGDPQQPHDYTSAAGWYRRAAEAGDVRGIESLADLHARGLGVPEDPVIAKMLELIAASPRFGGSRSSRLRAPLSGDEMAEAARLASAWRVGSPLPRRSSTRAEP